MISLQVENLSKRYVKRTILDQLSFTHNEGVLGISGANGSGKSTLLKCICYLAKPTKGSFNWIESNRHLERAEVKPRIGLAAPYINVYAELTAEENIRFIADISKLTEYDQRLDQLIDTMDIRSFAGQEFGSLSTGQKQRVKLAVSLIRDPDILVLDEPGSNLDTKGHSLVEHIVNEAKNSNKCVIIASNDPKEMDLCDQIISL